MSVVARDGNHKVLCKLLVILQVQLQTVHTHHTLEFYHLIQAVKGTLAMFDWVVFSVPRVMLYTTAVAASHKGIWVACIGAYE